MSPSVWDVCAADDRRTAIVPEHSEDSNTEKLDGLMKSSASRSQHASNNGLHAASGEVVVNMENGSVNGERPCQGSYSLQSTAQIV